MVLLGVSPFPSAEGEGCVGGAAGGAHLPAFLRSLPPPRCHVQTAFLPAGGDRYGLVLMVGLLRVLPVCFSLALFSVRLGTRSLPLCQGIQRDRP